MPSWITRRSVFRGAAHVLLRCIRKTRPASERQRPGRPRGIKCGRERVFVLELLEARRCRLFSDGCQHQNREGIAVLPAAVKGELSAFPQCLQNVSGKLRHGSLVLIRDRLELYHSFFITQTNAGNASARLHRRRRSSLIIRRPPFFATNVQCKLKRRTGTVIRYGPQPSAVILNNRTADRESHPH